MNQLTQEERTRVVACLVEGNSIRATVRMTGIAKNTVAKLLVDLGRVCSEYQDKHLRNLKCRHVQCDEIWSFCYAKQKNVPPELRKKHGYGDVWTWTALDADTKLVLSWLVGLRDAGYAHEFMRDVAARITSRIQLTTDGHKVYLEAVEDAFGGDVDYAMLVKLYGKERAGEARYSPAVCLAANPTPIVGNPERRYYLDELRRTAEPDYANGNAPVYPAHEWLLQEGREP